MLTQRLRWAQGTVQVMLRENPLVQRGLTLAQRLMYFATMWSYLSGFAALVYIAAPIAYLTLGVLPVQALSTDFFVRLVPFLLVNQLLFFVVADGRPTWRGPAVLARAVPGLDPVVHLGLRQRLPRPLARLRGHAQGEARGHRPALGPGQAAAGRDGPAGRSPSSSAGSASRSARRSPFGTIFNMVWVVFDLVIFSVIIQAVRYRGFEPAASTDTATGPPPTGPRRPARPTKEQHDRVRRPTPPTTGSAWSSPGAGSTWSRPASCARP